MLKRNYSQIEYFNQMAKKNKPLMSFDAKNIDEWKVWKTRFKRKLFQLLGEFPKEKTQLNVESLGKVDEGDYIREKVVFNSEPDSSVPAYILIPKNIKKGEKRPALLCAHGHGQFGKDSVAGITNNESNRINSIKEANYDYGKQFALKGYVTIIPDWRGFGERDDGGTPYHGRDKCNVHFIRGSLLGVNLLMLDLWDGIRTIDYLVSRPEIDSKRIGCIGLSFGGTMTTYMAIVEPRIKAACICCYVSTFYSYAISMGNFCGSQYIPGLYKYGDLSDVYSLIAPKPLLFEYGIQDMGFPVKDARESVQKTLKNYKIAGVPEKVDYDEFDGGHQFSGRKAFDFFDKWL